MKTTAATFHCDITPPVGHPLCAGWYPPATAIGASLSAHGLILIGEGEAPVVLCALDWAELSNHDYNRWREDLAAAVNTEPDRVAVHCVHPHDTPWPDRDAQDLLDAHNCPNVIMVGNWCEQARANTAAAAGAALDKLQPCTHITTGQARVDRIASNRRVMGEDGKVRAVRWTKTQDPELHAAPEGTIDPFLKTIGFWNEDRKITCLHYYAVHPTTIDGTGIVTPEFVGLARNQRIAEDNGIPHIYFTACAGNITAGKYNDGNIANRPVFTGRIYDAILASENTSSRQPLTHLTWNVAPACLPPREDLNEEALLEILRSPDNETRKLKSKAALILTYMRRWEMPIPITSLRLNNNVDIVHLPGETFIEYQLYAQELRPQGFVAVAGYGDLGPGYITLESSFAEGGYEPTDSFVSGKSEQIMRDAIKRVLHSS
ncbi:MAG: hypothetical protein O2954_11400 [bacterium]|nr:hypothetical protein [bacterium]